MRSKRAKQFDEGMKLLFTDLSNIVNIVGQSHQCCNCCIELHILNIRRYFLDGLMKRSLQLLSLFILGKHIGKSSYTLQETLTTLYRVLVPRSCCAVVTHEQYISTQGVCTVLFYNIQWVNNVALGFTHLVTV